MSKKDDVYQEISRRIDHMQNDIYILSDRTHEYSQTQGVIVGAVEKIGDQLASLFEKQDQLSAKMIESFKEHNDRFRDIEEQTGKIKIVSNHWKTIVWVIVISSAIGFAFDNGIKDILKGIASGKIADVTHVMREARYA